MARLDHEEAAHGVARQEHHDVVPHAASNAGRCSSAHRRAGAGEPRRTSKCALRFAAIFHLACARPRCAAAPRAAPRTQQALRPRRACLVARIGTHEAGAEPRRVGDRAREHAHGVERAAEGMDPGARDRAEAGLVAHHAAKRPRAGSPEPSVCSPDRHRHESGGDRRRRCRGRRRAYARRSTDCASCRAAGRRPRW